MKKLTIYCLFLILGTNVYAQQGFDKFAAKKPGNTFIGALIEVDKINSDNHQFLDIPQKSISISFNLPIKSREIIPSYNNMMDVVQNIIKNGNIPKQNVSFSHIIREIKSYDELSVLFGQKINPTLLFGVPENKEPKPNVVAMNLEQELFSIYMDIEDLPVFNIDNPKIEKDKLLYLNSVTFGRKAVVLIESNQSVGKIKEAINDVVQNYDALDKITEVSHSVLANSLIRIMVTGNNTGLDTQADNALIDALLYFNREITVDDFGSPITFTAAWLKDNSVFVNDLTF